MISPSGGSTLTLSSTGSATISNSGNNTIDAPIVLGNNLGVSVAQGGVLNIAGPLSGSHTLSVSGGGVLMLSGSNTYTGTTTISAGSLQIGNGGSLWATSLITDNGTLVFNRSNTVTQGTDFGGPISGSGNLVQLGPGMLVLTASNTYTGTTTISGGTLQIGNGGTSGSVTGNIVDRGVLVFDRSDNPTFAGLISGPGSLTQAGTGMLVLTGTNTFTGTTTIIAGTLVLASSNALGNSTAISSSAANSLTFEPGVGTFNLGGLSGSGSLALSDTAGRRNYPTGRRQQYHYDLYGSNRRSRLADQERQRRSCSCRGQRLHRDNDDQRRHTPLGQRQRPAI